MRSDSKLRNQGTTSAGPTPCPRKTRGLQPLPECATREPILLANRIGILLLVFVIAFAISASAQVTITAANVPVRELDDPNSGARWLLYASRNGGPGRLVLVTNSQPRGNATAAPILPPPIIRAGDRIVLEEHTAVVDARLEAIALGPAAAGGTLRVRLAIGGRIVSAVAFAPGRAELTPAQETQP